MADNNHQILDIEDMIHKRKERLTYDFVRELNEFITNEIVNCGCVCVTYTHCSIVLFSPRTFGKRYEVWRVENDDVRRLVDTMINELKSKMDWCGLNSHLYFELKKEQLNNDDDKKQLSCNDE